MCELSEIMSTCTILSSLTDDSPQINYFIFNRDPYHVGHPKSIKSTKKYTNKIEVKKFKKKSGRRRPLIFASALNIKKKQRKFASALNIFLVKWKFEGLGDVRRTITSRRAYPTSHRGKIPMRRYPNCHCSDSLRV